MLRLLPGLLGSACRGRRVLGSLGPGHVVLLGVAAVREIALRVVLVFLARWLVSTASLLPRHVSFPPMGRHSWLVTTTVR